MTAWLLKCLVLLVGLDLANALSHDKPLTRVATVDWIESSTHPDHPKTDTAFQVDLGLGDERTVRFQLSRNDKVLSSTAHVRHQLSDGSSQVPFEAEQDVAFYKGVAFIKHGYNGEWVRGGWARITQRRRDGRSLLEGAFKIKRQSYQIAMDSTFRRTRLPNDPVVPAKDEPYMVVWKHSDVAAVLERSEPSEDVPSCGTGHYTDARTITPRQFGQQPFNPVEFIGSTEGCPSQRRVALLGIATDCTYTSEFSSIQDARSNIISQINIASQLYEDTFNIQLAIQNLTISDASCPTNANTAVPWNVPCTQGFDISARLSTFSEWRGQFDDGNAIWTLLSACNTGSTVGIAWLSSLCSRGVRQQGSGNVASTNVVVRTRAEWQVIAHEIGHNFGATHDCTSQSCGASGSALDDCCPLSSSTCDADGDFIMNPVTGSDIREFSGCSTGMICTGIGRNSIDTSCFVSEDQAPDINESECGNGVVEGSETCDCGGPEGCPPDSCCNPETCQLREGADCDPTNDLCCTDSCRVASSGTTCRESVGDCDPEETCDGSSAQCPSDEHEPNGQSCGDGLSCASGICTSRDLQCANAYNNTDSPVDSCNTNSCQLFCNIPGQGCSVSSQDFLDGTSCGNGRMCMAGDCERPGSRNGPGGGGGNNGSGGDWFENNKALVIGVAAGVGGLIVLILLCCMISRFRKKKNAKRLTKKWPGNSNSEMVAQFAAQGQYGNGQFVQQSNGYNVHDPSQHPPPMPPRMRYG